MTNEVGAALLHRRHHIVVVHPTATNFFERHNLADETQWAIDDDATMNDSGNTDGGACDEVLPVCRHARDVAEIVRANPCVLVLADTGSGKTTQIPQILLKHGVCTEGLAIAVTQPRRVAAVSVARRVAEEMQVKVGEEVGYCVRFEDKTSKLTRIKYLTDGTLLREFLTDNSLSKYSIIMLDEAHERSLNTDILFGLLKKLVSTRYPALKLVITSATLESEKFSAYFGECPVYHVHGRTFPVQIAHATEAARSYFESTIETVLDIHMNMPPGDVLVFLTGQEEIERAVQRINDKVQSISAEGACPYIQVVPLYASLSPSMQARVFQPHATNVRRVIVSTNVAETSVTVPGIVYVVDPGVVKQIEYDAMTGMETLKVVSISAVQAKQRAGRAGRTQPGYCFRFYTKENLELDMPKIQKPEIQRNSLVGTILYLKTLNLQGLDVMGFEFLDPPEPLLIADALRQLYLIGAIDCDGKVTSIGRDMSSLPLEPCLARAMVEAKRLDCIVETATVCAMLSVERIFTGNASNALVGIVSEEDFLLGDHVVLLRIYQAWQLSGYKRDFHGKYALSDRGMDFARDIRRQLLGLFHERRHREYDRNIDTMRQSLCAGFVTKIAHRLPNHNGYRTLGENPVLAQVHPPMARQLADADGLLPEWIIYHELITTSRPFMRHVLKIEPRWIAKERTLLAQTVDICRLSGGVMTEVDALSVHSQSQDASTIVRDDSKRKNGEDEIAAARARFLARKKRVK